MPLPRTCGPPAAFSHAIHQSLMRSRDTGLSEPSPNANTYPSPICPLMRRACCSATTASGVRGGWGKPGFQISGKDTVYVVDPGVAMTIVKTNTCGNKMMM
jgi:hypothetical protein